MIHRFFARPFTCLFTRLTPWCASMMCMAMVLMVSVSSTLAMAQDDLRPPKSDQALSSPKVLTMIVAILLAGAVIFVATYRSKRTHQD